MTDKYVQVELTRKIYIKDDPDDDPVRYKIGDRIWMREEDIYVPVYERNKAGKLVKTNKKELNDTFALLDERGNLVNPPDFSESDPIFQVHTKTQRDKAIAKEQRITRRADMKRDQDILDAVENLPLDSKVAWDFDGFPSLPYLSQKLGFEVGRIDRDRLFPEVRRSDGS